MKKSLALLLTMLMLLGILAGCDNGQPNNIAPSDDVVAGYTFPTLSTGATQGMDDANGNYEALNPIVLEQLKTVYDQDYVSNPNMKYVLIYNPSIISDAASFIPTRSTGSFGSQVVPYTIRADGLETDDRMQVTPDELMGDFPEDQANKDGDRANGAAPIYRVGDARNFYCYTANALSDPRIVRTFSCRYAGDSCYIWVYNGCISDSYARYYGQEFDKNVYNQMAKTFGQPRFADVGGKIHLLYYPMPEEFAGCFCRLDLYASGEYSQGVVRQYGINEDHALIHMNGTYAGDERYVASATVTLAHEFQHLICASNDFYTADWRHCPSWFNEAMSGYTETMLYPEYSEQKKNYSALHFDYLTRHGQSLYNFNYVTPYNQFDFSSYDVVYLYASYLAKLAGEEVFSNFHRYWRYSGSKTLSSIEAVANAVDNQTYNAVVSSIDYGTYFRLDASTDFVSKLTLQFYLDMLDKDAGDPDAFSTVVPGMLLYDEKNPTGIQPGGRVIVAVNSTTYQIPSDASRNLMYIGLDANFKPVTDIVVG